MYKSSLPVIIFSSLLLKFCFYLKHPLNEHLECVRMMYGVSEDGLT